MLTKLFTQCYLYLYYVYSILYNLFLDTFGPIRIVYYYDKNEKTNITFSRHFWCNLYGIFYIKTYSADGNYHLAYQGYLDHLENFGNPDNEITYSKRKNLVLLNGNQIVNFDLNLLDNYRKTIHNQKFPLECEPVKNVATILDLFDCDSTDVQIVNLRPFKKEIIPIDDKLTIDMLYE
jgi:hypothetical protein